MDRDENNAVVNAQCPYFVRDTHGKIVCEGIKGSSNMSLFFRSRTKKYKYEVMNCYKINPNCAIKKMLDKQYEEK